MNRLKEKNTRVRGQHEAASPAAAGKKFFAPKLFVIFAAAAVIVFATVLGMLTLHDRHEVSPEAMRSRREDASEYVNDMFSALSSGDTEAVRTYFDPDSLLTDTAQKYSLDKNAILTAAFKNLSGRILMTDNTDTYTVTVSAEITTANLYRLYGTAIRTNIASQLVSLANPDLSAEEKTNMLIGGLPGTLNNILSSVSPDTVTEKTDIILERDGKSWKINMTDELADTLLGGINRAIETVDINSNN